LRISWYSLIIYTIGFSSNSEWYFCPIQSAICETPETTTHFLLYCKHFTTEQQELIKHEAGKAVNSLSRLLSDEKLINAMLWYISATNQFCNYKGLIAAPKKTISFISHILHYIASSTARDTDPGAIANWTCGMFRTMLSALLQQGRPFPFAHTRDSFLILLHSPVYISTLST